MMDKPNRGVGWVFSFKGSRYPLAWLIALSVGAAAPNPTLATDHTNLERGIPTSLEDIEPIERGDVQVQITGRYLRLAGKRNTGEMEPRLIWGAFEKTQLVIATPLLLGQPEAPGNGDILVSALRKLWDDSPERLWPGVAFVVDVRLPTGEERAGFHSGVNVELTAVLKKDVGQHSFHMNIAHEWVAAHSTEEQFQQSIWSVIAGHDVPLTDRMVIVTDVLWRQADIRHTTDIVLFEAGIRIGLSERLVAGMGIGAGLNRGPETPHATTTAGLQFSF